MKNTLKKIICVAMLAIMLVCALCACNSTAIFKKLNGMCDADYSKINITVKTEMGEDTLTSTYAVSIYSDDDSEIAYIDYSLQEFATFDMAMDADIIIAPDNCITTTQGSIEIKDGVATQQSGDPINIDEDKLENIDKINLSFVYLYFENAKSTSESFEADVKNPAGFMNNKTLTCRDMKVKVTFKTKFESIVITYTADDAKHTITYSFK